MQLFSQPRDYEAFAEILGETLAKAPMRICAFTLMPNHWHFVVWPEHDDQLGVFFQRLTVTHVTRWARVKERVGLGHVYQGRFKSFPVEKEHHFYQLVRYVERNPLRANLVENAADWRWSSLWVRNHGAPERRAWLCEWPVPLPRDWVQYLNQPETEAELQSLRHSVARGAPYGSESWILNTASALDIQSTLRPRGRPFKSND